MPSQSPKELVMSYRDTQTLDRHHFSLPRGWVILGLGLAAWISVIGMASLVGTAFQAILATLG